MKEAFGRLVELMSCSRPGHKLVDVTCAFYNKSIFLSTLNKNVNCLYSALACDSVHCVSYMQLPLFCIPLSHTLHFTAHSAV